ncbi:AT hook motif domain protein [Corallococcus sp. EGB]|uniref:AT hook motif domain protein n=1 Tax=Corallococcus sp. EGB TaxID=1521117 RepID=UPI001CBA72E0|nr:AT hook motif domain protein [Corallococcus sp. EGB]
MAKKKAHGGRPTKDEGPKLSQPEEVERLLVEGEVVPGPDGEAKRVWLTQRDVAARFNVSPSLIAEFAKKHRTTEHRAELRAKLDTPKPPPPKVEEPDANAEDSPEPTTDPPDAPKEKRRPGRPRRQDAPLIPFEELDRLLVFGEVQILDDGKTTTVYPSYRALAEKYGVVPSVIAEYARSHNTMKRRKLAAMRIEARKDEKLVELRSDALAVGETRLVAMIDDFLVKFEEALKDGRVRTDSPADVNTLVRLKQFIMGGADSRQEVRNILSLEALQERYARMMRETESATPAMAGVVIDVRAEEVSNETEQARAGKQLSARFPPGPSLEGADQEPNLSRDLRPALRDLVNLARELAETMGADPDDHELIENRVLRAVERVEAARAPHDAADVGPRGAEAEEDEG